MQTVSTKKNFWFEREKAKLLVLMQINWICFLSGWNWFSLCVASAFFVQTTSWLCRRVRWCGWIFSLNCRLLLFFGYFCWINSRGRKFNYHLNWCFWLIFGGGREKNDFLFCLAWRCGLWKETFKQVMDRLDNFTLLLLRLFTKP